VPGWDDIYDRQHRNHEQGLLGNRGIAPIEDIPQITEREVDALNEAVQR
jgi:hypothetical protein